MGSSVGLISMWEKEAASTFSLAIKKVNSVTNIYGNLLLGLIFMKM